MTETTTEDYDGYKPSTDDIVIKGCRLIMTSCACPEQYDVFDEKTKKKIGYLRLRGGYFRADAPDCGDETVYESETNGDGMFDDDERMPELRKAVKAILEANSRS